MSGIVALCPWCTTPEFRSEAPLRVRNDRFAMAGQCPLLPLKATAALRRTK